MYCDEDEILNKNEWRVRMTEHKIKQTGIIPPLSWLEDAASLETNNDDPYSSTEDILGKTKKAKKPGEKQHDNFLWRGDLLKRAIPYLEADLLGRLYSELQGVVENKVLCDALEQECCALEALIEEIRSQL